MGRFINLGIAIVNTSYIIRVEMESDGRAEIYMSDGTMFRCDHFDASQLYGTNEKKEGATSLYLQEELRYDQSHSYNNNYGLRRGSQPRLFPSQSRSC